MSLPKIAFSFQWGKFSFSLGKIKRDDNEVVVNIDGVDVVIPCMYCSK